MDNSADPRFRSLSSTPVMKVIQEEDSPVSQKNELESVSLNHENSIGSSIVDIGSNVENNQSPFTRPIIASPIHLSRPNSAFYASKDNNNSSSSLIYNPSFSFGTKENGNENYNGAVSDTSNTNVVFNVSPSVPGSPKRESRRGSLKYIPNVQLAPPTMRSKSPRRSKSPKRSGSPESRKKRGSVVGLVGEPTSPFNFNSSSMRPQSNSSNGSVSGSRAAFRKGHRYKHSSVSMNFFQEPEVKIPLNIAKSLPIPDWHDIISNIPWPKAYIQLSIVMVQILICLIVTVLGHIKGWNNFITLSHFILYDIIGSLAIILVENLSQFESWSTGTITYPFGLKRVDVLMSFALAISLCFVGLDLLFHILEEVIVIFVESSNHNHEEIASTIPHSHGDKLQLISKNEFILWYAILIANFTFSASALYKIFYANTNSKLKTKNPLVTLTYNFYLFLYPMLLNYFANIADYVATLLLASLILTHGFTIVQWTSTILLMGFSTTTLSLTLVDANDTNVQELNNNKLEAGKSELPITTPKTSTKMSPSAPFKSQTNTVVIISKLKEKIESLPEFKARCHLDHDSLLITKINFDLYVVLIKISMRGGSNNEELQLRLATEKCVKRILPLAETTIDINIVA